MAETKPTESKQDQVSQRAEEYRKWKKGDTGTSKLEIEDSEFLREIEDKESKKKSRKSSS